MDIKDELVVFEGTKIRRTWHNEQCFFSVVDVIQAITNSGRPRKYWSDLKKKLIDEGFELYDKIGQLKVESTDGKKHEIIPKNHFHTALLTLLDPNDLLTPKEIHH